MTPSPLAAPEGWSQDTQTYTAFHLCLYRSQRSGGSSGDTGEWQNQPCLWEIF